MQKSLQVDIDFHGTENPLNNIMKNQNSQLNAHDLNEIILLKKCFFQENAKVKNSVTNNYEVSYGY